jgi:hypothetical protein
MNKHITTKERARRVFVRFKSLFTAKMPVKIPNFWYTPFEVYLLAHIKRAHFIFTYNEYFFVDRAMEVIGKIPAIYHKSPISTLPEFYAYTLLSMKDGTIIIKKELEELEEGDLLNDQDILDHPEKYLGSKVIYGLNLRDRDYDINN